MRTSGGLPLRESPWSQAREREEQPEQEDELAALKRNCPLTREHTASWVQRFRLVSILRQEKMQTTVRRTSLWACPCTGQARTLPWTRIVI